MIIFLHGDDTYRSKEKLRELREKFRREVDPSGMNLATVNGVTASASEIWGAIAAQSFLVRKRMVIVEDLGLQKSAAVRQEVLGFLERIPEDAIVVFWEARSWNLESRGRRPSTTSRGRSAKTSTSTTLRATTTGDLLFSKLLEGTYVYAFSPLEGPALATWVRERCAAQGASIAPKAIELLVAEVGSDLWRMHGEIEKVTIAAGARTITPELVGSLITTTPHENLFGFLDAVGSGDRAAALRTLRDLEANGTDPFALVGMLARHVRLLVAAADLLNRGTPLAQLAVELRTPPFVARKIAEQARRHEAPRLRRLLPALAELDATLKSSRAPWQALVELFCLEVTA